MSTPIVQWMLKVLLLWLALLLANIITAPLLDIGTQGQLNDGPFTAGEAFLLVNALHALVLGALAANAGVAGVQLFALIATTSYLAQSFLLIIEALYFSDSVRIGISELMKISAQALLVSLLVAVVSALLWRRRPTPPGTQLGLSTILSRLATVTVCYLIMYFVAGYFIAWAAPEVRSYYDQGASISLPPLIGFQLLRGALWALLAWYIAQSLRVSVVARAGLVGLTFGVLATAQLLYPNDFMPWSVRLVHLIEVLTGNFVFGVVAVFIWQKTGELTWRIDRFTGRRLVGGSPEGARSVETAKTWSL